VVTDRGYVAPDLEVRLMERINRDFLTIHDFNAVGSHNKSVLESDFGVIIEKLKSLEAALSEEREKSASLTARIEKLEAEHLRFTGTWQREAEYVEGDLAQHAGSLWLATLPSIGQCPVQTPTWRLLVKRGSLK